MRQTELSLNKRDRRIVDEFRSKGLHMAREFNRAHILAALDSKLPEQQIMEILNRYRSLEAATARAARYAESAQKAICTFPDSEIKRALLWAPEFVVAREK